MAFTSWTDLKTQLLNDLASGSWTMKSYSVAQHGSENTITRTFRDLSDFRQFLEIVEYRAAAESGTIGGRTYARQGGGGRW